MEGVRGSIPLSSTDETPARRRFPWQMDRAVEGPPRGPWHIYGTFAAVRGWLWRFVGGFERRGEPIDGGPLALRGRLGVDAEQHPRVLVAPATHATRPCRVGRGLVGQGCRSVVARPEDVAAVSGSMRSSVITQIRLSTVVVNSRACGRASNARAALRASWTPSALPVRWRPTCSGVTGSTPARPGAVRGEGGEVDGDASSASPAPAPRDGLCSGGGTASLGPPPAAGSTIP